MRRIREVVELRPELDPCRLHNPEIPEHREIIVDQSRSSNRISACRTETVRPRLSEGGGIEPELSRSRAAENPYWRNCLREVSVARTVAGRRISRRGRRGTRCRTKNTIHLPASNQETKRAAAHKSFAGAERQFIQVTYCQHVSQVIAGRSVVLFEIQDIDEGRLIVANPESLAVCISDREGQSVREALRSISLKGVVVIIHAVGAQRGGHRPSESLEQR